MVYLVCIIGILGYLLQWLVQSTRDQSARRSDRRMLFRSEDDDYDDDE